MTACLICSIWGMFALVSAKCLGGSLFFRTCCTNTSRVLNTSHGSNSTVVITEAEGFHSRIYRISVQHNIQTVLTYIQRVFSERKGTWPPKPTLPAPIISTVNRYFRSIQGRNWQYCQLSIKLAAAATSTTGATVSWVSCAVAVPSWPACSMACPNSIAPPWLNHILKRPSPSQLPTPHTHTTLHYIISIAHAKIASHIVSYHINRQQHVCVANSSADIA